MTLPIARDLSKNGIRCMTIAPGIFGTPMLFGMPQEVQDALAAGVPLPEPPGQAEDYANLVQSDRHQTRETCLTGEVIRLDGAIRLAPLIDRRHRAARRRRLHATIDRDLHGRFTATAPAAPGRTHDQPPPCPGPAGRRHAAGGLRRRRPPPPTPACRASPRSPPASRLTRQPACTVRGGRSQSAGHRGRPADARAGGSALDAAIAVQMVLTLVEPQSSGIGGGAFLLHWDGQRVQAFDGRETAPGCRRRAPVPDTRRASRWPSWTRWWRALGRCPARCAC